MILNDLINEEYNEYREKGQIEFITFHPSYSYEEFMEGITVHTEKEGVPTERIQYKLKAGIFKEMCKRALASAIGFELKEFSTWKEVFEDYQRKIESGEEIDFEGAKKYLLIIDEINRGDISKIFGELITLLECDKRLGANNNLIVKLPYSNDYFGVPPNLYVIGTMNTADRSIALIDVALRRRFGFKELMPDFELVKKYLQEKQDEFEEGVLDIIKDSINCVEIINKRICEERTIGRDKQIGHSYFFTIDGTNDVIRVWQNEILPLLEEYCYGNYEKISDLLFREDSNTWINKVDGIKGFFSSEDLKSFLNEVLESDKNE